MKFSNKYDQALYYEIFQKEEYQQLKSYLIQAKEIIDIWGHLGYFSLWCKSINPDLKIHFYEPILILFEQAKENLKNHQAIEFHNLGIASTTRTEILYLHPEKSMQSSKYHSFLNQSTTQVAVAMVGILEFLAKEQLWSIDLIKMDIEGMEWEVFEKLQKSDLQKAKKWFCEYHLLNPQQEEQWNELQTKWEKESLKLKIFCHPYHPKLGYFLLEA